MSSTAAKINAVLEPTIAFGLLVVMAFAVLAHGAVEAWSVLLFEVLMTALLVLWAVQAMLTGKLILNVPQTIWPLVALLGLGLAQSVSFLGTDGTRKSLSLDVEATRSTVLIIICLLIGTLLAANFWTSHSRLETLTKWMTVYGLVLALFAIVQHFTWNGRFYWLRWNSSYAPFGPFVNRNHFAGYMELLLPWPVAMMLRRWGHWQEQLFYGVAAVWIGIAAVLTLSRGGMISIVVELMLLVALSVHTTSSQQVRPAGSRLRFLRFAAIAIIFATIVSGVVWLGGQRVFNRITTGQETEGEVAVPAQTFSASRGGLWRVSWLIFQAHPLTGAGLGAYETAFSLYNDDKVLGQSILAHAHNDYLQSLTDGGMIGGFIALWFLFVLVRSVKRGLRVRDSIVHLSALACWTGIFGLLVHSLFDYNLQLPSHSLFFVVNAAILWQIGKPLATPMIQAKGAANELPRSLR